MMRGGEYVHHLQETESSKYNAHSHSSFSQHGDESSLMAHTHHGVVILISDGAHMGIRWVDF